MRIVRTAGLLLAVTGLALPAAARSAVLDVPLVYPGIQQAVDAAAPGDVIRVGANAYQEHVRIRATRPPSRSKERTRTPCRFF